MIGSYNILIVYNDNGYHISNTSQTFPIPTIFNNIYITFFGACGKTAYRLHRSTAPPPPHLYYAILQSTHKLLYYVARFGNKIHCHCPCHITNVSTSEYIYIFFF